MAKRAPLATQEERLQRTIRNAEQKIVELKGLIDTDRRVVAAQHVKVEDPASPQIIRVSEGGNLALGNEGNWQILDIFTETVSHTGDTDETTLRTVKVPANFLGSKGAVRISLRCRPFTGAEFNVYWGAIDSGKKIGFWTHATVAFLVFARPIFVYNKGVTDEQGVDSPAAPLILGQHWIAWGTQSELAEDTTGDVNIYFTVKNAAAGNESFLYFALVEAIYRK